MFKVKNKIDEFKKKLFIEQATGIRLTERQFKAYLITTMLTGLTSCGNVTTKQEMLDKIPEVKEVVEDVLTSCILDPLVVEG